MYDLQFLANIIQTMRFQVGQHFFTQLQGTKALSVEGPFALIKFCLDETIIGRTIMSYQDAISGPGLYFFGHFTKKGRTPGHFIRYSGEPLHIGRDLHLRIDQ
jgi:hypothetical protein